MPDLLLTLKSQIQSADSMTRVLRQWCDDYQIGSGPLRSQMIACTDDMPPSAAIQALDLQKGEATKQRRIVLMRGDIELLEADNWYIPSRLPAPVNHVLTTTDTPFGATLPRQRQSRRTLSCDRALPTQRQILPLHGNSAPVLTVRAVVLLNKIPVAYVEERLRPRLILDIQPTPHAQSA